MGREIRREREKKSKEKKRPKHVNYNRKFEDKIKGKKGCAREATSIAEAIAAMSAAAAKATAENTEK